MSRIFLLIIFISLSLTTLKAMVDDGPGPSGATPPASAYGPLETPWGPLPTLMTKEAANALCVAKLSDAEKEHQKKLKTIEDAYHNQKTWLHLKYSSLFAGTLIVWGFVHTIRT